MLPCVGRAMSFRERLDAFPTQLVLVVIWATVGLAACLIFRESLLWVILMSWYAIVVTHFAGHLGWRAKRAAQGDEEEPPETATSNVERAQRLVDQWPAQSVERITHETVYFNPARKR